MSNIAAKSLDICTDKKEKQFDEKDRQYMTNKRMEDKELRPK